MAEHDTSSAVTKAPARPKRDSLGKFMVVFAFGLFLLGIASLILAFQVSERDRDHLLVFTGFSVLSGVALIFSSRE